MSKINRFSVRIASMTLLVASLLLSSCGLYTTYERPEEIRPETLIGRGTEVGLAMNVADSTSADLPPWYEMFTDPYLRHLLKKGLQNNTDLQIARLRVEEAEATLLSARLAYLPSFAFAPQGTVSSFGGSKASYTYSLPVEASWSVDLFGRIRNAKRQSKALMEQSEVYRQAVQTTLVANIANAYYTLLMLDAQLDISRRTEQSWKETVSTIRLLMQAGMADETAVAQMEGTYYSVRTSILDLQEQIEQVENSLSLLLAEPSGTIERGRLEMKGDPFESPSVGIPFHCLSNRPDVREAEKALEAAFYATREARGAFYPSLTLGGSIGWTNTVGDVIVNPGKFLASAIGSLTQPLFGRGENIARLKIAKARQEEARLAFWQALLNAGSEVNDALTAYQTAREKSALYDKQIEHLTKAYEGTSLLMSHGSTSYLEVLTAQQTLYDAHLVQVANRLAEIQGVISLYQALGGGGV